MIVVFIGPDGCGKSSVIATLSNDIKGDFPDVIGFHLFPCQKNFRFDVNVSTTEPHALPLRGKMVSVLKLFYYLVLYIGGYLINVRAGSRTGHLFLFDRYYHDLLIDPRRYRYGGPIWLARWVGKLVPKPDLWIFLRASVDVLQGRKQEVLREESELQNKKYLEFMSSLDHAVLVDASLPLNQVVGNVKQAILEHAGKA